MRLLEVVSRWSYELGFGNLVPRTFSLPWLGGGAPPPSQGREKVLGTRLRVRVRVLFRVRAKNLSSSFEIFGLFFSSSFSFINVFFSFFVLIFVNIFS